MLRSENALQLISILLFSGYEIYGVEEFLREYTERTEPLKFFFLLGEASSWWRTKQDIEFFRWDGIDEFKLESSSRDLWKFCPVARLKTDYLVFLLRSNNYTPSIVEHLDNLIASISNGSLQMNELGLDFPVLWDERV